MTIILHYLQHRAYSYMNTGLKSRWRRL